MSRYEGLNRGLVTIVRARDGHRCRWCGVTNAGYDPHHIRYRRGDSDDVADNLILLCRRCHNFVHGTPNDRGLIISKGEAQSILFDLITMPGVTGSALWRQRTAKAASSGQLCEHGRAITLGKCHRCASGRVSEPVS